MAGRGVTLAVLGMALALCARAAAADEGTIKLESNKITLVCDSENIESLTPLNQTAVVEVLVIQKCPLPNDSYASALRVLNINVTTLSKLSVTIHDALDPTAKHFERLSITTLNMKNDFASSINFDANILDTVTSVANLTLTNMRVPPLPASNRLVNVTLVDSVSRGEWGGCEELVRLELWWWEVLVVSEKAEGWLEHCSQLRELGLHNLTPELVRHALAGARALVTLTVHRSRLTHLPSGLLADAVHLRTLNLSDNHLVELDGFTFQSQPQLQVLDLSFNRLQHLKLKEILAPLKELRDLSLEGNNAQDLIAYQSTRKPLMIERVSMRMTSMEWSYLTLFATETLSFLDLSNSNMTYLDINALLKFPSILVDLRGNNIFNIYPKRENEYQEMSERYEQINNVTILVDFPANCDSFEGRLPRMLRSMPRLVLAGASCSAAAEDGDDEWRNKFPWNGCSHRRIFTSDNHLAIEIDCRGAEALELPFNIRYANRVLASGNLIERLYVSDFSRSLLLEFIDLQNNSISHINANVTAALFSVWGPRVRLAGNPLACDCANRALLEAMREFPDQVEDYENITCAGDVRLLRDVDPNEVCYDPASRPGRLMMILLVMTVIAIVLSAALCYRYQRRIKAFLFARGYRLSCLSVEKINSIPDSSFEYRLFRNSRGKDSDGCDVEANGTTRVSQEHAL